MDYGITLLLNARGYVTSGARGYEMLMVDANGLWS